MQRQLFELLRRTVPHVPSALALRLAVIAGGASFRAADGMRANSLHNISRLLDLPEGHPRVRRATLGAFCTLARNYVDMLTIPTLTKVEELERTEVVGFERLPAAQARGQGVLIATAHIGNPDAGGQSLLVRDARCAVLAEKVKPDWLFDFFARERAHFGGVVVPVTANALPQIQRALRDGLAVGIACDWDMQGTGIPVVTPPFRHALRIPAGVSMLALRNKAPIVPVWTERLADGRTRTLVDPEIDIQPTGNLRADMRAIAVAIAGRMLPHVRAHPGQWVLFHRVWEAPDPASPP